MKEKIKVLVHPSDRTGVGYFRSTRPHIALEDMYPDDFHVDIDYDPRYDDEEFLKQYDIIHYHRTFGPYEQMSATTETLKRLGIKGIMDLDDYWSPGTHHPAYLIIKQNGLDKKLVENIKVAEYVMTTTPIFAKEMNKFNKNTLVIPNAIDPSEKQFIHNPEPSERIRIGWLGGSSHLKDLEILKGVVSRLKSEGLIDKVQFVLCGFDTRGTITSINEETKEQSTRKILPHESVWTKYEEIFTDNYSTISPEYKAFLLKFSKDEWPDVANEAYRRVWTKPINTYASNYNLFDISLAPLEENIFNKVKSQLKVIEAGFHKKALIAQNYGPYQVDCIEAYERGGTINPKGNAFLIDSVKNHKDWFEQLKRLIKNPQLINQLANNLYDTVKDTYSLESVTKLRAETYKKLLDR
jgi:glycosyltransferase involved in cell wall biosynthesis